MPDTSNYLFIGLAAFWIILFVFIFLVQRKVTKLESSISDLETRV